jgi:small-conductance mechanosensitive channel
MSDPAPSVEDEARRLLALSGSPLRAFEVLEKQMGVLVLRTQVMLSLSGIVITVTGFSGRAIAETSDLARGSIAVGLVTVLAAAVVAIVGVLRLRWLSQLLTDDEPLTWLVRAMRVRDDKARLLSVSLKLFVAGFALYCLAVAQLIVRAR